jgi:predicted nucleotidyltransferase
MQGAIEGEARQRLAQQFAEAEALANQLRPEGQPSAEVLAERQQALLEALDRGAPAREIRQLMAQIKLLEPDAYGTRAAVEGVVGEQQRIARGSSRDYMEPGRELPADRPARLAVLAQEASSSLAKMFGHAAGETGNSPSNVRDMAKYLARVYHAFREAGLAASHPLLAQTGGVVGAKHETDSAAATMREVRAWAEDNNLFHLSDQQLRDRWVSEAQALGQQLVVRLRTSEQITGAVEGPPPPPPRSTGGDDGGGDGAGGGGRSGYDGIEAREGVALGGEAHRLRIGEEDGQLVVKLCTNCRRLRQRFERVIDDPSMEGMPDVAREIERLHHQAGRLERDLNRNRITAEEAQQQCDDIAARLNELAQEHPQALGPAVGIPRGFTDRAQLEQFGKIIRDQLEGLIFYVEAHIQGSAVRGRNWETGRPFGPHSDIDLAIVSEDLHDIAASADQARGNRTEPNPPALDDILSPIRETTSELLDGREVNIMIFRNRSAMEARGDSIKVPIYEYDTDTDE